MTSTASHRTDPVRKHRRDVLLRIVFPVALAFLALVVMCVVLAVAVATGSLESTQITVVMGLLATLFVLIPMTLLCLVPYFLLAMAAVASGRGYAHAQTPLRFSRRLTGQIALKTDQLAPKLARPLLALNVRVTRWEHMLSDWLRPAEKETNHE